MLLDNLLLWLHVAAAIFCVGPVTVTTSLTPRYIRNGELPVVRFLLRTTRVFGVLTLLVLVTGIVLGRDQLAAPWLTVSMTLFIVAFALLFGMVQRDQSAAVRVMSKTAEEPADADPHAGTDTQPVSPAEAEQPEPPQPRPAATAPAGASVQTGRIAAFSAVIALLWLVILVFMVWQPGA